MNKLEALHTLGLDEGATPEEIKAAYRETAQILHPDRFQGNHKLQDRATEQFQRLQEAYDTLMGKGSRFARGGRKSTSASSTSGAAGNSAAFDDAEAEYQSIRARLAGLAAARTQLVAQRDVLADEQRTSVYLIVIGAVVSLLTMRRIYGLLALVGAVGVTLLVWGIARLISVRRSLDVLDDHLTSIGRQKTALEADLDQFEVVYE